jgi:hypothetical protein
VREVAQSPGGAVAVEAVRAPVEQDGSGPRLSRDLKQQVPELEAALKATSDRGERRDRRAKVDWPRIGHN